MLIGYINEEPGDAQFTGRKTGGNGQSVAQDFGYGISGNGLNIRSAIFMPEKIPTT
jgi:hypothetical protein